MQRYGEVVSGLVVIVGLTVGVVVTEGVGSILSVDDGETLGGSIVSLLLSLDQTKNQYSNKMMTRSTTTAIIQPITEPLCRKCFVGLYRSRM